jgi:3-methyl-2-oxobutanoate hydroxymethyltransferase
MSHYHGRDGAVSVKTILQRKVAGEKVSMVTCYDYSLARIIDRSAVDMVLVGDSLGSVMLGFEDTTQVTMDQMVHHTAAVHRGLRRPLLCADLPFLSYQISPQEALRNAGRLVQEGGAQCVKLEGGAEWASHVKAITRAGIPVVGHLGLTPQSVHMLGGYRVQGREEKAQQHMLADAKALEDAGVFAIVLELIPSELAQRITSSLTVPTIGIGAGPHCDGQVLVLQDLLGFNREFNPRFLKKYANLGEDIQQALDTYNQEVKNGSFPTASHSF